MVALYLSLTFASFLLRVTALNGYDGYYPNGKPISLNGSTVNFTILGFTSDTGFNPALYRDGGGGGMTGTGVMVLNFADSFTLGGPYGTAGTFESNNSLQSAGGQVGTSFVHNSFAVMKDLTQPLLLTDFGFLSNTGNPSAGNGNFSGMPLSGGSADFAAGDQSKFAIWPQNNLLGTPDIPTLPTHQLVGVFPAIDLSTELPIYSTLGTINVNTSLPSGKIFSATRNVTYLFNSTETMYGTFCIMSNGTAGDGYVYLFGTTSNFGALRMARVPWATLSAISDRSKYQYWNGSAYGWVSTPPADGANTGNLYSTTDLSGVSSTLLKHGTVFWSNYYHSYMIVYNNLGYFDIGIAVSARDLTKGFTNIASFYIDFEHHTSTSGAGDIDYMLNVYPQLDKTGKTLTLSWSSTSSHVMMGKITFVKT